MGKSKRAYPFILDWEGSSAAVKSYGEPAILEATRRTGSGRWAVEFSLRYLGPAEWWGRPKTFYGVERWNRLRIYGGHNRAWAALIRRINRLPAHSIIRYRIREV